MNERELLDQILALLLTPAGAGACVAALAAWIFRYVPEASSTWKKWVTLGMSLVIPPLAYGLKVKLSPTEVLDPAIVLYYVGVGYMVSQITYEGVKAANKVVKKTAKKAKRALAQPPEEPPPIKAVIAGLDTVIKPGTKTGPLPPLPPEARGYPAGFRDTGEDYYKST